MDINGQIKKAQLESLASDPTGTTGRTYFNTVSKETRVYDGTVWTSLSATAAATSTTAGTVPTYQSGTASAAVTGTKTTFPSISISYTKIGDMVTITLESKGAGWTTTKNNSGGFVAPAIIPTALIPNDYISFPYQQNRNGTIGRGQARIASNGDIEFYRDEAFNNFADNDTWTIQNRQSFSYNVTAP